MAALAAAALVAAEGLEPILHVNTRDRNRIALVSEALGAQALGVRNVLCTSGSHQTLGRFRAAKNVYDIDSIQLLRTYARLADDCGPLGEGGIDGAGGFCLGAVASPDADPLEWQVSRLQKKTAAGAVFLITQPVFDPARFDLWWQEVTRRGIHEKVAILAGIQPLGQEELAAAREGKRRPFKLPEASLQRVASKSAPDARRAAAVEMALEMIEALSRHSGLRGFAISSSEKGTGPICAKHPPGRSGKLDQSPFPDQSDTVLEIIEKSALGSD
jgi:methylenetetrahydrofolate reductase (NADPH)